jgi:alkylation response protein AidB-like acyl-CoA dehydrogenase
MVLAAELEMLRDSARRLAEDARPAQWSSIGRRGRSDPALWAAIAGNGWLFAGLDESAGGFGFGAVEMAVLMEEVGRGLIAEPLLANMVGLKLVARLAPDQLRDQVVAAVTEGRSKIALAYAEPDSRFAWQEPGTTIHSGGDALTLDGVKSVVMGGADADLLLVVAQQAGDLVVVLVPVATDGVTVDGYALIDGTSGADVRFVDVRLTADARIGCGALAVAAVAEAIDFATVAICAQAVGAMTVTLDTTLDYVKQRVQFGQPIGTNQVLQHRLVDMLRMIKEAEILTAAAVAALDGDGAIERGLAVSAAKIHVCDAARKVGQEAVQMHGAIGTTDEAAISHYFRRLIALGPLFGDGNHHRNRFAALDTAQRATAQ